MITGSEDGYIRAVSIGPNKVLNYLGNHSDGDDLEPITRLGLTHDMRFAASVSYDNWIKFYNITTFVEGRKNAPVEDDEEGDDSDKDDEEMMDEDSDDDDEGDKNKSKMPLKTDLKQRKREIKNEKRKEFFSDI